MKKRSKWLQALLAMTSPLMLCGSDKNTAGPRDISSVDPNFKTAEVGGEPVEYVDALAGGPFRLTGFPWRKADGTIYRMPDSVNKDNVNEGVLFLSSHTSGGQISFRTDSRYIAIRADINVAPHDMGHMPRTGSSGFDFYEKTADGYRFRRVVAPTPEHLKGEPLEMMVIVKRKEKAMRSWRINLPLYGGVRKLELGLEPGAKVEAPEAYTLAKPILFYGSSITQGGCASRPGNNYSTMLCRKLDAPQINLGFSGCAKGEISVAEAIASLDLAAFVMDYDHNAPNAEHLAKTHGPFFRKVREAHPDLPILLLTRGDNPTKERTAVVRETYEKAVAAGDKNVYFIDGADYFAGLEDWATATVDGCHPNDLGFYLMYQRVLPVLKQALGL
ncbi:MAG: SGNH/GDSL hydrolase family protein [Lentisphaeria bacterium]|nr:SGNH/GDSL hydrolase family protein [Lentisphaeria bacterium]